MSELIYLDNSATTPTDPRVVEAMQPYWSEVFGNASSLHAAGKAADAAIQRSIETIAGVVNCRAGGPPELVFTSGGTEADNLALKGVASAMRARGRGNHVITTAAEHHAVLDVAQELAGEDFDVTFLPVDSTGRVTPEQVVEAMRPDTVLVSVLYASNEIGSINPIADIGAAIKEKNRRVPFHTDAVQAPGLLPLDVQALNVDLMSLAGHKCYGPKGIGVLVVRRAIGLKAQIVGGGQQAHRRSGTEPLPLIVGLARALELAEAERAATCARLVDLRDELVRQVLANIPEATLTGHPEERLAGHSSFVLRWLNGDSILLDLSELGICASGGSACTSGQQEPSHVLLACGVDSDRLMGQMRFVLGKHSTAAQVERLVYHLRTLVERHRAMAPQFG